MNWKGKDPYFILSLDGGGIWAVIEAMALREMYGGTATGHDVLQKFNLVTANSGGSIVLAAMAANMSLDMICTMFADPGTPGLIFSPIGFPGAISGELGIGPKYSTPGKLKGLRALLPTASDTFSNVWANNGGGPSPDILIAAFDYDRRRATFFRSNVGSLAANFPRSAEVNLLDAVNASTTAPVIYFDLPAQIGEDQYWDGGVAGYNNPVLAGVVEALANHIPPGQIKALSIGTGKVSLPIQDDNNSIPRQLAQARYRTDFPHLPPAELHNLAELAGSILDDPPDAASFEAHVALNQRLPQNPDDVVGDGSIVRMNPMIQPIYDPASGQWQPPKGYSPDDFSKLAGVPMDATDPADVQRIMDFASNWLIDSVVNQPIRASRDTFEVEIGQRWFSSALAAWKKLQG